MMSFCPCTQVICQSKFFLFNILHFTVSLYKSKTVKEDKPINGVLNQSSHAAQHIEAHTQVTACYMVSGRSTDMEINKRCLLQFIKNTTWTLFQIRKGKRAFQSASSTVGKRKNGFIWKWLQSFWLKLNYIKHVVHWVQNEWNWNEWKLIFFLNKFSC